MSVNWYVLLDVMDVLDVLDVHGCTTELSEWLTAGCCMVGFDVKIWSDYVTKPHVWYVSALVIMYRV